MNDVFVGDSFIFFEKIVIDIDTTVFIVGCITQNKTIKEFNQLRSRS